MKMTRPTKIFIGIATLLVASLPFVIMALAFLPMVAMPFAMQSLEDGLGFLPPFFGFFFLLFPVMMCITFLQLGLMIFYIIHIVKNKAGAEVYRILTAIGLYFLPFFAMPFYYLVYIWPEEPPEWALEKT